jgi:sulfatase modifying factor 1
MSPTRRQFLNGVARFSAVALLARQEPAFRGRTAGEERDIDGIRMCWCPAGRFTMGSPPSEAGRRSSEAQVQVTLSQGFWAGKYEVTQVQWRRVMKSFPDRQPSEQFGIGDDAPAYWISFEEAEAFAAEATRRARKANALPAGWQVTLPTEAQWEYACRAGTTTATSFGEVLGLQHANFSLNAADRGADAVGAATRVGSYPANAWGLHDMHGNVWEWCRDWYHAQLPGGTDPDLSTERGVMNRDGTYSRVRRGGAWIEPAWACRSAARLLYEPHRRSDHIGFRVLAVDQRR